MKKILRKKMGMMSILYLSIILLFSSVLYADTVAFKTVVSKNDMTVSGDFWLDVQIRITAGTSPRTLNSLTADVYFGNQISYASADNWAYSYLNGYSRNATNLTTYIRVGTTGNNVNAEGGGTPPGWNVTSTWQTIVNLKFTINTATSVDISINDATNDAAYFNNIANNPLGDGVTDWDVSNEDTGNVTLPVELSVFTAQFINNTPTLYWTTSSETDNVGWFVYRNDNEHFYGAEVISDLISGYGTTSEPQNYILEDNTLEINGPDTLWYWLESIDLGGIIHHYDICAQMVVGDDHDPQNEIPQVPIYYGIYQNFPNPYNPNSRSNAKILYCLKNSGIVKIDIYNIKGQLVRNIINEYITFDKENPSPKMVIWDGKDSLGKKQKTGIYFYRLQVDGKDTEIRKMIVMD